MQEKLLPPFIELHLQLPARAGTGAVEANLTEIAEQALVLHRDLLVGSGLFADPELLQRFRGGCGSTAGPHRACVPIVAYVEAEQALGRLAAGADLAPLGDRPSTAAALVRALLAGLVPAPSPHPEDRDLEARA